MMHYGINSKLNKEKSHTIKQNNPYGIPTFSTIKKLFIYTVVLISKNAS
jgi:hypothetical protein